MEPVTVSSPVHRAPAPYADVWRPFLVHVGAGLGGVTLGVAAAVYSHDRTASWSLAAFVFILMTYTVGRGGARVLTQPRRLHRTFYFALLPALATALLLGSYVLWGQLPLSVALGLIAGGLLHGPVGRRLVPSVAHGERWRTIEAPSENPALALGLPVRTKGVQVPSPAHAARGTRS